MKRTESHFKGFDGINLFFQEWLQEQPAKGLVIISHGQGEHSDSYQRLIEGVASSGWNFIAWDWRGHGKSQGKRGYAADFSDYVKDYSIFIDLILSMKEFENLPIILLGHSMGGLIQLNYLTTHKLNENRIKAQILSSPLLGLTVKVPQIKDMAARLAHKIYPQITMHNELTESQFTRDPQVLASYPKDSLRHHKISPGVYIGFLRGIEEVFKSAGSINLPTLMQLSGNDTVVSTPASERFFEVLGSKIKKKYVYSDRQHESYNDLGREEVYQDFLDFLQPIK